MDQNPITNLYGTMQQAKTDAAIADLTKEMAELNARLKSIEELIRAQDLKASGSDTSQTYIK